ncbi:hypothetical protein AB2L28_03160 [Kineococcus sp. TBRC 1896]|uniref:Pectate lyase superfamily protein domain-containing protein n=1 Tax=Kineococcus mangrovi TaxID=1660183 RepID=A0ABV4I1S3_9ACTN
MTPRPAMGRRSVAKVFAAFGVGAGTAAVALSADEALNSPSSGPHSRGTIDALDPTGDSDCGPGLQLLYDRGVREVVLEPRGRYYLNTPVFLDSDDPFDCFVLHGNGADLVLGPDLPTTDAFTADRSTRWGFFPNTVRRARSGDSVAVDVDHRATGPSVGGTPRLVVNQLRVDGAKANRALAFFNRCSGRFTDVVMTAARTLVSWYDYCDAMVLDRCQGRLDEVDDAWLIYQVSNGDGITLISPKTERGIGIASLDNCKGATIASAIAGTIKVSRCRAISVVASHHECDLGSTTGFVVRSSQVSIDAAVLYPARAADVPAILVDDSGGPGSQLTLRDFTEMLFHRDGTSTVRASRKGDSSTGPLLSLTGVQPDTRVVAHQVGTRVGTLATGARWAPSAGFRITSDDDGLVQALSSPVGTWQLAQGSFEIVQRGQWKVTPSGGASGLVGCPSLQPPRWIDTAADQDDVEGSLTEGSVQYIAALRDATGAWTGTTPVSSVRVGGGQSARLRLSTSGPATLVVWRSTGADVTSAPEDVVTVPAHGPLTVFYDTGTNLGGLPWRPADDVRPPAVGDEVTPGVVLLDGSPLA